MTSHTNVAVDEAILRAAGPPSGNRKQGPLFKTPAYSQGKLLRYGPPKHAELEHISEELSAEAISRRLAVHLEARLLEIESELAEINDRRRQVEEVLEDWRKSERHAMEVRSKERALEGAEASLDRRHEEHDAAEAALAQARSRLDDVRNPLVLGGCLRKTPGLSSWRFAMRIEPCTGPLNRLVPPRVGNSKLGPHLRSHELMLAK